MMLMLILFEIWVIISIIDFFAYTIDCHKWNFINILWELIGKYL